MRYGDGQGWRLAVTSALAGAGWAAVAKSQWGQQPTLLALLPVDGLERRTQAGDRREAPDGKKLDGGRGRDPGSACVCVR